MASTHGIRPRFSLPMGHLFGAALLVPSLFACSSSEGGGDEKDPSEVTGTTTCDPKGDVPCVTGLAEPCEGLESGFLGDELCMVPPENGFQIHVGPSDYTDPEDTAKYMIAPGDETNWADITQSTNEDVVYIDGFISHMRPGSHHFILYGLDPKSAPPMGVQQTGEGTEAAVGAIGGEFLAGATRAVQDGRTGSENPEDQGYAHEGLALRPMAVNLHFINITDKPLLQEIWVNFHTIAESEVTHWASPITWYGGLGMDIPPGQHTTLKSDASPCTAPGDVRILGVTGHVHASTKRYASTMIRAGETERTTLFEDFDWHEPTEFLYNSSIDNGTPDASLGERGGYSGALNVAKGDQFFWECEVENKSQVNLHFSNKVYEGEMCNVFGFYASEARVSAPWLCFF